MRQATRLHPLTKARKANGVSMRTLALAVGCHKSSLSKIEHDKHLPSPALADRIATYLDGTITRDQLLFPLDAACKKPVRSVHLQEVR